MSQTSDKGKFYDEHDSYRQRRKKDSSSRKQYLIEIDNWKNKYLAMLVPSGTHLKTVIEIGCATGDLIARFPIDIPYSERYGIDVSPLNIEFAKKEYSEVNFYLGTFEDFLQNEGRNIKIDIIILSDILEHVERDVELLKLAGNHARYLLVNIPLEKCWRNRKRRYGANDVAGHLRAYSLKDIQEAITEAELRLVDFTVKYYCKEAIHRRQLKEQLIKDIHAIQKYRLLTRYLPKYIFMFLMNTILFRWYHSGNFFGLLSPRPKNTVDPYY